MTSHSREPPASRRWRAFRTVRRKLPPHVVVYLVMALALFADPDYEEAAERLTETLTSWGLPGRFVEHADLRRDHPGPQRLDLSRCGSCFPRWRRRSRRN